jgi:hypothetical protein
MKKLSSLALAVLIAAIPLSAERWNHTITVTAGAPIRISAGTFPVNRLGIQARHGNTGLIYIMLGVSPSITCNAAADGQLTAELGPGDSLHPGNYFSDPQGANGMSPSDFEDLSWACIDGTVSGDKATVTGWHRN